MFALENCAILYILCLKGIVHPKMFIYFPLMSKKTSMLKKINVLKPSLTSPDKTSCTIPATITSLTTRFVNQKQVRTHFINVYVFASLWYISLLPIVFSLAICMIIFFTGNLSEIVHDLPHSLLKALQFPSLNIILN